MSVSKKYKTYAKSSQPINSLSVYELQKRNT